MKKLFAATVAIIMVATMSVTAFAAEPTTITENNDTKNIEVKAKYDDNVVTPEVYSVDVEWGAMEFTYAVSGTKNWDAQNHRYDISNPGSVWSESGNTVKATNHSNVDIKATFTYAAENTNTLTGTFTYDNEKTVDANGAIALAKGVEGQKSGADYVIATLALAGTPDSSMTSFTKVGTITVKIEK